MGLPILFAAVLAQNRIARDLLLRFRGQDLLYLDQVQKVSCQSLIGERKFQVLKLLCNVWPWENW